MACTLFLILSSLAWLHGSHGLEPSCTAASHGSDLTVMHPFGPCSPFPRAKSLSWEDALFEMAAEDEARLLYLESLQVSPRGRKRTFVPIASGRQVLQSTAYIVQTSVGTPPQPMLMAMDISNDAAWMPCSGCVGCSSAVFSSPKSTSYKTLPCQASQCKQVQLQLQLPSFPLLCIFGPTIHVAFGTGSMALRPHSLSITFATKIKGAIELND